MLAALSANEVATCKDNRPFPPNLLCASVHKPRESLSHPTPLISADDPLSATNVRWRTDASRVTLLQISARSEFPDIFNRTLLR
jgi:hypothetical protein